MAIESVLATVLDRKTGYGNSSNYTGFSADVASITDYYPFGFPMSERSITAENLNPFRFGYNTQEKVNEWAGLGNLNTAEFGELDTRTGRRLNLDPKPNESISVYSVFGNSPIYQMDIFLDTPSVRESTLMADNSYNKYDPNNFEQKELKALGWNRQQYVKTNLFGEGQKVYSIDAIGAATKFNFAIYSRTRDGKTENAISFAGTDDIVDVGSDASQIIGTSNQYKFAIMFAEAYKRGTSGQELTFVGHSLGGGLANASALKTGSPSISFNPAGVSFLTRTFNDLPNDGRNGLIRSFIVAGEIVDKTQRLVGSKANGQITYIHPQLGIVNSTTAAFLRIGTDAATSVQYHLMQTVMQSLDKAKIK